MNQPRRPLDDEDIAFVDAAVKDPAVENIAAAEQAVRKLHDREIARGGPRLEEDIVNIVRELATQQRESARTQQAMQATQKDLQATVSLILKALEGAPLGDKTDGLTFRVGSLERNRRFNLYIARSAFGMLCFIFGRSAWVAAHATAWSQYLIHSLGLP